MSYKKEFLSHSASVEFVDALPPCAKVSRKYDANGSCVVTWEPLRLRMVRNNGAYVYPPAIFPVQREIEHAYLIRDELGQMIKVNRYTLMAGVRRFELSA